MVRPDTGSSSAQVHRRLTLNTISNVSRYVLSIGIAFYLTPFIVRTLGDSIYGFWVLLLSFIGYASILEMGVQPAVVKLVGQYRGSGEKEKLQELVTAALVFFLAISCIAALLCVTVVPPLVRDHVEGLGQLPRQQLLFAAIGLDAVIMYMNYLFTGVLYGCQRYHIKNMIDAGAWILNAVLVLTFLEEGGLLALVACRLAMDLFTVLSSVVAVRRVLPELRFHPSYLSRQSFRELMSFGGRVFASATTTRLATHAQPIIISTMVSSAAVAFYAIPVKLVDYSRQIAWTLSASFMPMFSELQGRNEHAMLRQIYLDYSRYIFLLLLPVSVLLLTEGAPFIGHWIGPEYQDRGHLVLMFLASQVLIESFQPLLWRFFIGVGHLNVLVKVSAIVSLLAVAGSLLLVRPMGIAGVAMAGLIGAVVAQSIYAVTSCSYLKISPGSLFAQVHLRALLAGSVMFLVAELLSRRLIGTDSFGHLALIAAISCGVYALLALPLAITSEERTALRAQIAKRLQR